LPKKAGTCYSEQKFTFQIYWIIYISCAWIII
jgi:hypothetical protein